MLFAKRKWLWKRDDTNQKQKEKLRIMLPNEKNANAEKTVKGAVTFIKGAGTLYQLDSYNGFWINSYLDGLTVHLSVYSEQYLLLGRGIP